MERIVAEMGTVIECGNNRCLTAMLEDGEEVVIPFDEIHRDKATYDFRRLIGRNIEIVSTGRCDVDGRRIYSHKTVEEHDFEWLRYNFETGKRNTYWAHYKGMTNNGTLAFYKIGDTTINGAISLKDFSMNRISSYNDCVMPASIQVVITEISDGKIKLSSIPGFIGFDETIEMLKLRPGSTPIGKAASKVSGSLKTMITLTPNVATLIDGDFEGADVKVFVTNINNEKRKVKSRLDSVLAMPGTRTVDYNLYITKKPLPAFLTLEDYKSDQGYFKRRTTSNSPAQVLEMPAISEEIANSNAPEDKQLSYFERFLRSLAS